MEKAIDIENFLSLDDSEVAVPKVIRGVLQGLNDSSIISLTDKTGKIISINENFQQISGYSPQELIGNTHSIINSGYHSIDFWKTMWSRVVKNKVWRAEVCNKKKDGSFYWVDSFIYPLLGEDDKLQYILSIRNDITEKKLEQEFVVDLSTKLESIYNSTNELYFLLDSEMHITSMNMAAKKSMKSYFKKNPIMWGKITDFLPFELINEFSASFRNSVDKNKMVYCELSFKSSSNSELWFGVNFYPTDFEANTKKSFAVSFENITKRKKYEQQLEIRNKQLADIAWNQSHHIRGPVASLLGVLNLIDLDQNPELLRGLAPNIKELANEIDGRIRNIVRITEIEDE